MMKRFPNLRDAWGGWWWKPYDAYFLPHFWNVNSNSKSSKNTRQSVQRLTEFADLRGIYALLGKGTL